MFSAIQAGNAGTSTIAVSLSRYLPLTCNSFTTSIATEADATSLFRTAGVLSRFYVNISANTITAASTFVVRKATSTQTLQISVGASSSGEFKDVLDFDTVAAGDDFHYLITTGGTGTTITPCQIKILFNGDQYCVSRLGQASSGTAESAINTRYYGLSGSSTGDTTEALRAHDLNVAGDFKNLFMRVPTNTRTVATTFGTRKNSAGNGNLSISVGISATGSFEDTSNTDTVAANDDWNLFMTMASGSGTLTWTGFHTEFLTTNREFNLFMSSVQTQSAGSTRFQNISGGGIQTTEASQKADAMLPIKVTNLVVLITSNTVNTGNSIFAMRKNAALANLSVSVAAAATGLFEDASNTDNFLKDTDEICTRQVVSGASGSLGTFSIGARAVIYTTQKLLFIRQAINRAFTY